MKLLKNLERKLKLFIVISTISIIISYIMLPNTTYVAFYNKTMHVSDFAHHNETTLCMKGVLTLNVENSMLCCDSMMESLSFNLFIPHYSEACRLAYDPLNTLLTSRAAFLLPLFPWVFSFILMSIGRCLSYVVQLFGENSNVVVYRQPICAIVGGYLTRLRFHCFIILYRTLILYLVLDGVERFFVNRLDYAVTGIVDGESNNHQLGHRCWYSSYRTCKNSFFTLDSSDHIILMCVQYGVPFLVEMVLYDHKYGDGVTKTDGGCARPPPKLIFCSKYESSGRSILKSGKILRETDGCRCNPSCACDVGLCGHSMTIGDNWSSYVEATRCGLGKVLVSICFYVIWRALWMTTHFHSIFDNVAALVQIYIFVAIPLIYFIRQHARWFSTRVLNM